MLLDPLVSVIETLSARARDHSASLHENEIRTRTALIDPLLQVLGWDVSDPSIVMPEYTAGGGRADYALIPAGGGKPIATIEAKKLGESLVPHRAQMLNYANMAGIEYAGITDGDKWEMYEVFKKGELKDRLILDVSIVEGEPHKLALQLLLLWRPNVAPGTRPVSANEPIIGLTVDEPVDAPPPAPLNPVARPAARAAASRGPAPSQTAQTSPPPGWTPLSEFDPPAGTPVPPAIRFRDGSVRELRTWAHLVRQVTEWLHSSRLLTEARLPVRGKLGGVVASSEPVAGYAAIREGSLYVYDKLAAAECRRSARVLLEHCGINPAEVHLDTSG